MKDNLGVDASNLGEDYQEKYLVRWSLGVPIVFYKNIIHSDYLVCRTLGPRKT